MTEIEQEQLRCLLQKICEKLGVQEYVFVMWDNTDTIGIMHDAVDRPTIPMNNIEEFANQVALRVQQECRTRKQ